MNIIPVFFHNWRQSPWKKEKAGNCVGKWNWISSQGHHSRCLFYFLPSAGNSRNGSEWERCPSFTAYECLPRPRGCKTHKGEGPNWRLPFCAFVVCVGFCVCMCVGGWSKKNYSTICADAGELPSTHSFVFEMCKLCTCVRFLSGQWCWGGDSGPLLPCDFL